MKPPKLTRERVAAALKRHPRRYHIPSRRYLSTTQAELKDALRRRLDQASRQPRRPGEEWRLTWERSRTLETITKLVERIEHMKRSPMPPDVVSSARGHTSRDSL